MQLQLQRLISLVRRFVLAAIVLHGYSVLELMKGVRVIFFTLDCTLYFLITDSLQVIQLGMAGNVGQAIPVQVPMSSANGKSTLECVRIFIVCLI